MTNIVVVDDAQLYFHAGKWHISTPFTGIGESNGARHYYVNGMRHRIGAPASVYKRIENEWYINGDLITTWKEYKKATGCSNREINRLKEIYGDEPS